jgi:hypothetical protein
VDAADAEACYCPIYIEFSKLKKKLEKYNQYLIFKGD